METPKRIELEAYLVSLSGLWDEKVLKPLGLVNYDRASIGLGDSFWDRLRTAAEEYAVRLQEVLGLEESWGVSAEEALRRWEEAISRAGHQDEHANPPILPVTREEEIYACFEDFLNAYTRGVLDPHAPVAFVSGADRDHPFWELRRQFIRPAVRLALSGEVVSGNPRNTWVPANDMRE